jgi:hypothetical protein
LDYPVIAEYWCVDRDIAEESLGRGSQQLADLLRLPYEDMIRALGGDWSAVKVADSDVQWFASGDPVQVLIGSHFGYPVVAEPKPVWDGHHPVLTMGAVHLEGWPESISPLEGIAAAARRASVARRRRFQWCEYCRTIMAPENRSERGVCQGCAATIFGAVY